MMTAAELLETSLKEVPSLMSQNGEKDPILYIRFVHPLTNWEWYISEYDSKEQRCYGYVKGIEKEWGYFYLNDLFSVHALIDMEFKPSKFRKIVGGIKNE